MPLTLASMFYDFSEPGPIAEVKGQRNTSSTHIIRTGGQVDASPSTLKQVRKAMRSASRGRR